MFNLNYDLRNLRQGNVQDWHCVRRSCVSSIHTITFLALIFLMGAGCGTDVPIEEADHDSHEEEQLVRLDTETLTEFGIVLAVSGPDTMNVVRSFPGEVKVNADRYAHVTPRLRGVVHSVRKTVGDRVRAGEVLAVMDSQELADAKSNYLAGLERFALAESNFKREERLFEQKISAEQEFLEARQALAEARIALRSAKQKLHALGFSDRYIENLPNASDVTLVHYTLTAPIAGIIVEKHIVRGEAIEADTDAFEIADLDPVWIDLSIYQEDLPHVQEGQSVRITSGGGQETTAKVTYLRPILGEDTRTALARLVVPNPDRQWKPGMFVNGEIALSQVMVKVGVPKSALQTLDGQTVVFVQTDAGFIPQPVEVGRESGTMVEIKAGLESGITYVSKGGFVLKSQLQKEAFGDDHDH